LRHIIHQGVAQMHADQRLGPRDTTGAAAGLRYLVLALRQQAVLLGHPDWIGEDTLEAVKEEEKRKRALVEPTAPSAHGAPPAFELYPFWPPFWL
jgi:hypothetical protein